MSRNEVYLPDKRWHGIMFTLTLLVFFSGLLGSVASLEQCGSRLCKVGQVCESDVDGGTCYNSTSKIDCQDGITYCYKPRQCCGVSTCCPENSDCCGFNTCCPKGAVCCNPNYCCERGTTCCGFQTCCPSGSHCDGGECKADRGGPFKWWYIFFFLAPTFVLVAVVLRRKRRAAALRAAGINAGGVTVAVPVHTREQYGYDQGPINYNMPMGGAVPPYAPLADGRTTQPSCPPPPYSDAAKPVL